VVVVAETIAVDGDPEEDPEVAVLVMVQLLMPDSV
jgi:hypothetical protein